MLRCKEAAFCVFVLLFPMVALGQDAPPRLAKIIEVSSGDADLTRRFFGRVAARETVDLAFQVSGQIVEFPAIEGEPVKGGGLIAQLDLEPFQLSYDRAKFEADQAQRTLDRLQQLVGSTVTQSNLEDAQTQAELTAIALRNAERELEQATLTAPFDALVAMRNTAVFSTVSAGAPVVRLHDMSELRIEIDVPELLFQQAGENPDVDLWATFPSSDARYQVFPREFVAETSAVGQTFRIALGMPPPEGLVVLPGSSVTVDAVLKGEARGIEIPVSALVTSNAGQAQVFVFQPQDEALGTVALTAVEIEPSIQGRVHVVSGLEPGQEIVASGGALLQDGATVRRFSGF